jgi:hypothetical protein
MLRNNLDQVMREKIEDILQCDFELMLQNKEDQSFMIHRIATIKDRFKHMWT